MNLTLTIMRNPLNATEAFEQLLQTITIKFDEHQHALENIWNGEHDMLDNDAASMADYHEGAVEVLSLIQFQAEELFKNVN